MRTACLLRRSWSHLHRVSQGIGSNYVLLPSPRTLGAAGQRFFSASSVNLSIPLGPSAPLSFGSFAPSTLRPICWSSYRGVPQDGSARLLAPDLRRVAGIRGISCAEEEEDHDKAIPCPWTSSTHCKSKIRNEFDVVAKDLRGRELGNDELKLHAGTNDFASLQQRVVEESRDQTGWDKIERAGPIYAPTDYRAFSDVARHGFRGGRLGKVVFTPWHCRTYSSGGASPTKSDAQVESVKAPKEAFDYSQRAVVTALWCNFLVLSLKLGAWVMTSSHVMLAEAIHSLADLANQGLIAYGLMSSRRAPDAMHPYGYTKERFVWSLISAVGIFCLGSGATIIHGLQNLWNGQPLENVYLAALVIGGSMIMEGASLLVAISCVRNGAKAEGMTVRDYLWRGHDPTTVAVMMEDGAAVTGLAIAAAALTAAHYTGNPMWDPIGSIVVGNLLGAVAIFLIQRNRHALLGRSMDEVDMMRVLEVLCKDPVVDAIYDCKSEVIGPGAYRFKAEIDFNGVTIVQNYIQRAGRGNWHKEFQDAVSSPEPGHLDRVMAAYGEEVVAALGSEVDRLEREIQRVVPGIRHVDIEAHNPNGPVPREKLYLHMRPSDNLIST